MALQFCNYLLQSDFKTIKQKTVIDEDKHGGIPCKLI